MKRPQSKTIETDKEAATTAGYGVGMQIRRRNLYSVLILISSCLYGATALAGANLETERAIGKVLMTENKQRALMETGIQPPASGHHREPGTPRASRESTASHGVAVLPQIGYDPQAGIILGLKYSNMNFTASNMSIDIGATFSTKSQVSTNLVWTAPHLFRSNLIGIARLDYELIPTKNFFGLGNNRAGPDPLSTHESHRTAALFTLGLRLAPHIVGALTLGYQRLTIGRGHTGNDIPSTLDRFPGLPGSHGGNISPVAVTLVYNTQRDLTRPTQGWNVIGKIEHVGPVLGNQFNYTRYLLDAAYVHPIYGTDHVIGVRLDSEYVNGNSDDLPFFEYASIGGANNLKGFFPDRFLGHSRIFLQAQYKTLLADFNFYDIWRVRIDGAIFGGLGRVFLDRDNLTGELQSSLDEAFEDTSKLRYSYGAGLHIALSEALVARIEAGFSKEEKGLIYLDFGHIF